MTTLKPGMLCMPLLLLACEAFATPAPCTGTHPQLPARPAGIDQPLPILEAASTYTPGPPSPSPIPFESYSSGQLHWPTPTPVPTTVPSTSPTVIPSPTPTGVNSWCIAVRYSATAGYPALDDEQIGRVNGAAPLPAAWDSARTYSGGETVSYNGQVYKAKWWTQNDAPGNAYGPWELQQTASGPQAWDSTRVYNTGDQATYNGNLYQAKWWTQGNAPGEEWGPWTLQGAAPNAQRPAGYEIRLGSKFSPSTNYTSQLTFESKAPFDIVRYSVDAQCTVQSVRSRSSDTGSATAPQRLEIRRDGQLIATLSGAQFVPNPQRPIAPEPDLLSLQAQVRNDDGSCRFPAGHTFLEWRGDRGAGVTATITLPERSTTTFLSTRACNGDSCRPSPLFWESQLGTSGMRSF
ncbi:carbohydrate-binding protein [Chitinilyticum litopenaei]|uniref:carbohydrate-binding protein n=1 Tax=Chitinilyticum litopenaei TaxID=1121276 RepID=UPI00042A6420|nr:carbohydrate-binding protein [Chitinilyticum litopenaei]